MLRVEQLERPCGKVSNKFLSTCQCGSRGFGEVLRRSRSRDTYAGESSTVRNRLSFVIGSTN
eukprot:1307802-Amphidinium_carterae.1